MPPQSFFDLIDASVELSSLAKKAQDIAIRCGNENLARSYEDLRKWANGMKNLTQSVYER